MPDTRGTQSYLPDEKKKKLQVVRRDKKVRIGPPMDPKVKQKLNKNLEKARKAKSKSKK